MDWHLEIEAPANGRVSKTTVLVLDKDGKTITSDKADLSNASERPKVADRIAKALRGKKLAAKKVQVLGMLEERYATLLDAHRALKSEQQEQAKEQAGPPPLNAPWRFARLPRGYAISPAGCVVEQGQDNRPNFLTRGPVWVEAFTRDGRFGGWGALLVWYDRDGREHRHAFPAGRFHEQGVTLVQELADGGMAVVPGNERNLLRYLAAFDVPTRFRSVTRVGWADEAGPEDAPVYVLPSEVLGAATETVVFQPEEFVPSASSIRPSGTLEEWRREVAEPTRGNPILTFGLAGGFAGPLLKFAGAESGGFNLHGLSSRGKTTWLQVAGSVWGNGADPTEAPGAAFVKKWNTTSNALEALAAAHCDGLLALDEIAEVQARDLGRAVYHLAGGLGKGRLTRGSALRPQRAWRALIFSTGETPVQSIIEGEGVAARAGQIVRMVDVPAAGADGEVIHDPKGLKPAEFVQRLKRACATYYGTAGPEFVRVLCRQAELAANLQKQLDEAARSLCPNNVAAEVARVVRRFALLDVAGRMAAIAGVLPHSQDEIRQGVKTALDRWLAVHGRGGELGRAVARLRDFILANESRFRARDSTGIIVRDLVGYRDQEHGRNLFLFTPAGFKESMCGHPVQEVLRYLNRRGWLFRNEGDRFLSQHRVEGFDQTIRLYAIHAVFLDCVDDAGVEQSAGAGQ